MNPAGCRRRRIWRFVDSLMRRVVAPGKMAGWIASPPRGIDGKGWDFEYVRFS